MAAEDSPWITDAELAELWVGRWVQIDSTHPGALPSDGEFWDGPFTTMVVSEVQAFRPFPDDPDYCLFLDVTGIALAGDRRTVTVWSDFGCPPEIPDPYDLSTYFDPTPTLFDQVPA